MPKLETQVSEELVQARLGFVRGAMGAASVDMSDPYANELLERYVRGEITHEESSALMREHVLGDEE